MTRTLAVSQLDGRNAFLPQIFATPKSSRTESNRCNSVFDPDIRKPMTLV